MKQLKLTAAELEQLGFTHKEIEGKKFFELPGINSSFIYNPDEIEYVWYHKTVIGEAANWLHLDISQSITLIALLTAFKLRKP